jgi:long-subunit acyl-CoA synthetase (AMP-forming)
MWRFLGIMAKNRHEWLEALMACCFSSVTVAGFYDTLGIDGCEYILSQTGLTTVACAAAVVPHFIRLAKEGRKSSLQTLVLFDKLEDDKLQELKDVGLNHFSFQDVVTAG